MTAQNSGSGVAVVNGKIVENLHVEMAKNVLHKVELIEQKKKYNELKMAHAVSPLENPIQLRSIRRSIARIATEITNREAK